jgi:hypothetical protein
MNIIRFFLSVQGEVDEAMDRLRPIIDVVGGRPGVDGPGLVGADDERQRLRVIGISIIVRTIKHGVRSPLKTVGQKIITHACCRDAQKPDGRAVVDHTSTKWRESGISSPYHDCASAVHREPAIFRS